MTRREGALWAVRLMGILALAVLANASCGGDNEVEVAAASVGALEVTDAYARGVMDGGAVYFTVRNTGDTDDALVGVSTEVAGTAGLHMTVTEGTSVKMQPVAEIEIPAKGEVRLQPGGYHIMMMDLEAPLEEGDTIEVVLTFEKAGSVSIQVPVTSYEESGYDMDDGMGGDMRNSTAPGYPQHAMANRENQG